MHGLDQLNTIILTSTKFLVCICLILIVALLPLWHETMRGGYDFTSTVMLIISDYNTLLCDLKSKYKNLYHCI